ncbi:Trehalose utilization [Geobacillus sp. BCO2]|nr:Trehalose utilization [Geobacillus sp. BCO2]
MTTPIRVVVWNEFRHEKKDEQVRAIYPEGMHTVIASYLAEAGFDAATAVLDEPEHGLTDEVLDRCDVLVWWGISPMTK